MTVADTKRWKGKDHQWAVAKHTRMNGKLLSLLPTISHIAITIYINKVYGQQFYTWLNANYTPFDINAYWTFGITTLVYWIGGLGFMLVDLGFVPYLQRYKIQPASRVTWSDYKKVMWVVARNQVLIAFPLALAMGKFSPLPTGTNTPSALATIGIYLFCLACEEAGFYYVHKTFHNPRFYKFIHKEHHLFTAPVAFSSTYCTLTEHLLSNILPIVLGIMVLRPHWSMNILFFCSLEMGTLSTHSGYNISGSFNALQHDFHHYSFTQNFGPTGLLDQIHGTNDIFKAWLKELSLRDGEGDGILKAREEIARRERDGIPFVPPS